MYKDRQGSKALRNLVFSTRQSEVEIIRHPPLIGLGDGRVLVVRWRRGVLDFSRLPVTRYVRRETPEKLTSCPFSNLVFRNTRWLWYYVDEDKKLN